MAQDVEPDPGGVVLMALPGYKIQVYIGRDERYMIEYATIEGPLPLVIAGVKTLLDILERQDLAELVEPAVRKKCGHLPPEWAELLGGDQLPCIMDPGHIGPYHARADGAVWKEVGQ